MSNLNSLNDQVKARLGAGERESDIRKFVRQQLGLGKSQGNAVYNKIRAQITMPQTVQSTYINKNNMSSEKEKIKNLEFDKKWIFNKDEKTYVVFLKSASRAILVDEETHNNMLRAYTSKEEVKVEDICSANDFPLSLFNEYKTIFGWTRNGSNLSDEMIESKSVEELVEDTVQNKRWEILQESKKRIWKETESNSRKWMEFEENCLWPFDNVLQKWSPPKYVPAPNVKVSNKGKGSHSMLIIAADWHVGGIANPRYLYRSKEWNYDILCEAAKEYSDKIRAEINSRSYPFEEAVLAIGGDMLHTLTGFTDGGTKLEYEFIGEEQMDFAFSLMVSFVNELLTIFPKIRLYSVSGNHDSLGDYVLSKMLSFYYKEDKRIEFEISTKRYLPFKILSSLVILDHGASGKGIRSKLPRSGAGREAYVKGIFLENPELLLDVKSKLLISNDKHHFEHTEYNDFDLIISPTIVKGCRYADFSGFKSRPAQSVHVFDNDGIKEMIRFYFD